jgi:glycogen synthase
MDILWNLSSGESFAQTMLKSQRIFEDKENWNILMQNAFNSNFAWDKSVIEYEKMYNRLIFKKQYETIFVQS